VSVMDLQARVMTVVEAVKPRAAPKAPADPSNALGVPGAGDGEDAGKEKFRGRCFNCNEVGHRSADCPKPKASRGAKGKGGGRVQCTWCGRDGHIEDECYAKREAESKKAETPAAMAVVARVADRGRGVAVPSTGDPAGHFTGGGAGGRAAGDVRQATQARGRRGDAELSAGGPAGRFTGGGAGRQEVYMDSATSRHMTGDRDLLSNVQQVSEEVVAICDGSRLAGCLAGCVSFTSQVGGETKSGTLKDVLYVPSLSHTQLSVSQLARAGHDVVVPRSGDMEVYRDDGLLFMAKETAGMYVPMFETFGAAAIGGRGLNAVEQWSGGASDGRERDVFFLTQA